MRQVENLLVVGVAVHGRHEAVLEPEVIHHDLDDGNEAVGGAGGVRDDVVLGGIVLLVIHAHADRDVLTLGGRRNHDLFGAGGEVLRRAFLVRKAARAFEHELYAEILPGELLGFLDRRDLDRFAVHDQRIALRLDRAGKAFVDGVVLQQMGQRFGIGDVVDADELDLGLLRHGGRAQYVAADSSEPVDPYPHCHDCSLGEVWNCGARERHALDPHRAGLL